MLRRAGLNSLFLDFEPDGIPPGRDWELELYGQLDKADLVLFLATASSIQSRWCFAEIALAKAMRKAIVPVVLEPGLHHPLLSTVQEAAISLGYKEIVQRVLRHL